MTRERRINKRQLLNPFHTCARKRVKRPIKSSAVFGPRNLKESFGVGGANTSGCCRCNRVGLGAGVAREGERCKGRGYHKQIRDGVILSLVWYIRND